MDYVEEALKRKVWAVVGATDNKEKFGYKIYKNLKLEGYIYAMNRYQNYQSYQKLLTWLYHLR